MGGQSGISGRARFKRWFEMIAVIVAAMMVGAVAAMVLAVMRDGEQVSRDARLSISGLHEQVVLQETLVEHAQHMEHLTADLPDRLAELQADTVARLEELEEILGDDPAVEDLRDGWGRFHPSIAARLSLIPFQDETMSMQHESPPTARHETADRGMLSTAGAAEPSPTAGHVRAGNEDQPGGSGADAYGDLIDRIGNASAMFRERAVNASRVVDVGAAAVVGLEALVLGLVFSGFARSRRRSALAATERRVLERSEARFRTLVQNAADVVAIVDTDGRILYESAAVEQVMGYQPDAMVGQDAFSLVHPDDRELAASTLADVATGDAVRRCVELRVRHADDSWRWIQATVRNLLDDPSVRGIVINYNDVTERKQLEDQLRHRANYDDLTGLANRSLFRETLKRGLARTQRHHDGMALLLLDLDNFKAVNDSLGHAAGDELLVEVARRLESCLRANDLAVRLGGDEFAAVLDNVADMATARAVAARILDVLNERFLMDDHEQFVGASIGIAATISGRETVDEIVRNADVALYLAKDRGKGQMETFDAGLHAQVVDGLQLENDLRSAVENDQFAVHYQPMFDAATRDIVGVEALVRWDHPRRGLLMADEFIAAAERSGLIGQIGRFVLVESIQQAVRWHETGLLPGGLGVTVNVSPAQLARHSFVRDVVRVVEESGLPPDALTLELTEAAVLHHVDTVTAHLDTLRAAGVRLAIDDFGTGYSSFDHLRRLPVDVLKIDRSFIARLDDGVEETAIVQAILSLAETMNLSCVAEGVETQTQADRLERLGCRVLQGFLLAEPASASRTTTLLQRGADDSAARLPASDVYVGDIS